MAKKKETATEAPPEQEQEQAEQVEAQVPAPAEPKPMVAMNGEAALGMEELDQEDFIVPRITLIQPTSTKFSTAGVYFNNLSEEGKERMRCCFLRVSKGRVLFDDDLDKKQALCGSNDNMVPAARFENPQNPVCNRRGPGNRLETVCALAKWSRDKDGKSVPPACRQTYNFLGLDVEEFVPFSVSFRSSGVKPVRQFLSRVNLLVSSGRARGQRLNLFNLAFDLGVAERTVPKKHFIPEFSNVTPLEEEDAKVAEAMYHQLQAHNIDEAQFDESEPEPSGDGGAESMAEAEEMPDWTNED